MHYAEPDADAGREPSLTHGAAERILNLRRQRQLRGSLTGTNCGPDDFFMAVRLFSDGFGLATTNASNRSGRAGRTASNFCECPGNLPRGGPPTTAGGEVARRGPNPPGWTARLHSSRRKRSWGTRLTAHKTSAGCLSTVPPSQGATVTAATDRGTEPVSYELACSHPGVKSPQPGSTDFRSDWAPEPRVQRSIAPGSRAGGCP